MLYLIRKKLINHPGWYMYFRKHPLSAWNKPNPYVSNPHRPGMDFSDYEKWTNRHVLDIKEFVKSKGYMNDSDDVKKMITGYPSMAWKSESAAYEFFVEIDKRCHLDRSLYQIAVVDNGTVIKALEIADM